MSDTDDLNKSFYSESLNKVKNDLSEIVSFTSQINKNLLKSKDVLNLSDLELNNIVSSIIKMTNSSLKNKDPYSDIDKIRIKFPKIKKVPKDYFLTQEQYLGCLKNSIDRVIYDANEYLDKIIIKLDKIKSSV